MTDINNDAGETLSPPYLEWIALQMPRTVGWIEALPGLSGFRLALSVHLDAKMLLLLEALLARNAELFVTTCNPNTVRDEVVGRLVERGAVTRARRGMSDDELTESYRDALAWGPSHLCEMGAALTLTGLSADPESRVGRSLAHVEAGLEATGSGIMALSGRELPYPVFNWDDLPIKEGLHNRYMVGLTVWQAFCWRTRLSLHGKRVVVVGYGSVGRGLAEAGRAFGGTVSVAEVDGARRLEASYGGWPVGTLEDLLPDADIVVTATGRPGVIGPQALALLKNGCFLVNAGHTNTEIDRAYLATHPSRGLVPFVREISLPGSRSVFLFADGGMANLVAGEGDSLNSFDVTLALLTSALIFLSCEGSGFAPGLHSLPEAVWRPVVY